MAVVTSECRSIAAGAETVVRGEYRRHDFRALGTACRIILRGGSRAAVDEFVRRATGWLSAFEDRYSRFRDDSTISRINRAAGGDWVPVEAELESMFALCDWFHWHTQGIFDPTALPLELLWDYRASEPRVPSREAVERARDLVGWQRFERRPGAVRLPEPGMAVDIGGIGKEYAVDRVAEMAADAGVRDLLVDLGRDIRVAGEPPEGGPWRIGLENPADPAVCWAGLALADRAVATSGDYARGFDLNGKRYGHIIDPRTGCPAASDCQSVTVIAPTCTEAGILAKTAFVLGADEGHAFLDRCHQAEGCIRGRTRTTSTHGFSRYLIR